MTKLFKFIIPITVLLCSVSCYSKDEIETKNVDKPVLGNAAESITISLYNDLVVDYSLDALELFDILVNYQDGVPVSNKYLIETENNEVLGKNIIMGEYVTSSDFRTYYYESETINQENNKKSICIESMYNIGQTYVTVCQTDGKYDTMNGGSMDEGYSFGDFSKKRPNSEDEIYYQYFFGYTISRLLNLNLNAENNKKMQNFSFEIYENYLVFSIKNDYGLTGLINYETGAIDYFEDRGYYVDQKLFINPKTGLIEYSHLETYTLYDSFVDNAIKMEMDLEYLYISDADVEDIVFQRYKELEQKYRYYH